MDVDRAVALILLTRGWQILAAPVTLVLIVRRFSPEVQGFYYTFGGLLALQSFLELGFYLVIINVTSHEWAKLGLGGDGRIVGDEKALSRLISLGRLGFRWYAVTSSLFVLGVGFGGFAFFSQRPYVGVSWELQWGVLVALSGLTLWAVPLSSLLEGCNQVATINLFRLIQALTGSVATWATIEFGGGLWAAVVAAGVHLAFTVYLLMIHYRRFFQPFFRHPSDAPINWSREIWPLQWRLGLQGLVNYFMYSLFTPVMFVYHGAVAAGQMGMTWQIVGGLQAVALAWVQARIPRFGMLVAKKDYAALDELWRRTSGVSLAVIGAGSLVAWFGVWILNAFEAPVAHRLLSPVPMGLFLAAAVLGHIIQCEAAYLRAHKTEPLLATGVCAGGLTGFLVWVLGRRFGATGAAAGYLFVTAFVAVPWITIIWIRSRAEWHGA